MNCMEFNQALAEQDNHLSALPPALQEHRAACAACDALVEDLALIARQARVLRPMEAPSDRVWSKIQTALLAEGLIHAGGAVPADRSKAPSLMPMVARRAPMGLAYAAMFLVAAGVMYVHSLFTGAGSPPMMVARPLPPAIPLRDAVTTASEPNPALALARQAEDQMAAHSVNDMVERVPEEHRATFVSSWNRESQSIQQLVGVVQEFPDDPFLQMQLRNALVRQRMLQETSSRWNQ